MRAKVEEINNEVFNLDCPFISAFQFTKYEQTGHFDWHVDLHIPPVESMDRKLSIVIQLSESYEYEGGDMQLDVHGHPAPNELRQRGTLIVFPSFLRHRVSAVKKGTRYSLVGWYLGPYLR